MWCLEVAEHVEPALGDALVEFVAPLAPTVVFTAAHPGQGGLDHVNEQPREYWIERFDRAGSRHRDDLASRFAEALERHGPVSPWLVENAMVFERGAPGR